MGKLSGAEKKKLSRLYIKGRFASGLFIIIRAGMAELVDARDLGSRALCVRVRVSLPVSIYKFFRGV